MTGGQFVGQTWDFVAVAFDADDLMSQAAFIAPAVEEPAKAVILLGLLASKHFDNTTDGLVYGATVGLGFAMTENYLYFERAHDMGGVDGWTTVVITRSLFSALMHCAASATFGAALGMFRYRGNVKQWVVGPLLGYALAFIIHAFFNGREVRERRFGFCRRVERIEGRGKQ